VVNLETFAVTVVVAAAAVVAAAIFPRPLVLAVLAAIALSSVPRAGPLAVELLPVAITDLDAPGSDELVAQSVEIRSLLG